MQKKKNNIKLNSTNQIKSRWNNKQNTNLTRNIERRREEQKNVMLLELLLCFNEESCIG